MNQMQRALRGETYAVIASSMFVVFLANNALAQVVPDGTLASTVDVNDGTYTISDGTIVNGENQFHSFSKFDLLSGDIADFTGPTGILNIISRVTGGQSNINGTIRSSILGANLWLINPNGVVFESGSSLDISGSFHVSTADYLLLGGGGQFFADPTEVFAPLLLVGNPTAFGFLQPPSTTDDIIFNSAMLEVDAGETMSFVAHEVRLDGSSLRAPGGRLNLASVGSAGEVTLLANGLDDAGIDYSGAQVRMTNNSTLDVSGDGGGSIYIRGGQFLMGEDEADNENVKADTLGGTDGGVIDIRVSGDVRLQGEMSADTQGAGNGGNIRIESGNGISFGTRNSGIAGGTDIHAISIGESGDAGSISLVANRVSLDNKATIRVGTSGPGDAGDISITVTTDLDVNASGDVNAISSSTSGTGAGGNIYIDAGGDIFLQAGSFSAATSLVGDNAGSAGNITVVADKISNSGNFTFSTVTRGSGSGGNIILDARSIIDFDGGSVSASSTSTGNGGSVTLRAPLIQLSGDIGGQDADISANTSGDGNAGDILLDGDTIQIFDGTNVAASTTGIGNAGDVVINATTRFDLNDTVTSRSTGEDAGAAGSIDVTAGVINVNFGGQLSVSTTSDRTGNIPGSITIVATTVDVAGSITADTSGASTGSDVDISADDVDITGSGLVSVTTSGDGNGGTATINATDFDITGGASVTGSTSGTGTGGSVIVNADNVRVATDGSAGAGLVATTDGMGNGGIVEVNALDVDVEGNGSIAVTTSGDGNGGTATINSAGIVVAGNGSITGDTSGAGNGGTVFLNADDILVHESGVVSVTTSDSGIGGNVQITAENLDIVDGGQILASASANGTGGSISVESNLLTIGSGALIAVNASGSGDAGAISIEAFDSITMTNSSIQSRADNSDGGNIRLVAGELLFMMNSDVTTSAAVNAGNIQFGSKGLNKSPVFLIIQNNTIQANAGAAGGAIDIFAQYVLGSQNVIEALSDTGNDGEIIFDVPATDFVSVIAQLDIPFLNVAELLNDQCAESVIRDRSSFIVEPTGLLQTPDSYALSSYYLPPPDYSSTTAQHMLPGSKLATSVAHRAGGC